MQADRDVLPQLDLIGSYSSDGVDSDTVDPATGALASSGARASLPRRLAAAVPGLVGAAGLRCRSATAARSRARRATFG